MDNNPSILSHVSIGTNDFARAMTLAHAKRERLLRRCITNVGL